MPLRKGSVAAEALAAAPAMQHPAAAAIPAAAARHLSGLSRAGAVLALQPCVPRLAGCSTHRCRTPLRPPAAAIARRVYINQGMGVGAFRRAFGGRSNAKGRVTPEHHAKVGADGQSNRVHRGAAAVSAAARSMPRVKILVPGPRLASMPAAPCIDLASLSPPTVPPGLQAAGGVIRHALQQLEAMGLVEKNPAARGGRRITPEGQRQVGGLQWHLHPGRGSCRETCCSLRRLTCPVGSVSTPCCLAAGLEQRCRGRCAYSCVSSASVGSVNHRLHQLMRSGVRTVERAGWRQWYRRRRDPLLDSFDVPPRSVVACCLAEQPRPLSPRPSAVDGPGGRRHPGDPLPLPGLKGAALGRQP